LSDVLKVLKNAIKVLQRDPDISRNDAGDDELSQLLKEESMKERGISLANQNAGRGRGMPPGGRG